MKSILTSLILAASIVACTTEVIEGYNVPEEAASVPVSISAGLLNAPQSYASDKGGATNLDTGQYELRYIAEIWTQDAIPQLAARQYRIVTKDFTSANVSFDVRLAAGRIYDVLIWADFVAQGTTEETAAAADNYYQTNDGHSMEEIVADPSCERGLRHVALKGSYSYDVNNDARDAYCTAATLDLRAITIGNSTSTSTSITLTRPFGKLRVIGVYDESSLLRPAKWQMKYDVSTLPAAYNVLSQSVIAGETVAVGSWYPVRPVVTEDVVINATAISDALIMALDYLFPTTGLAFTMRGFDSGDNAFGGNQSFTGVTIQRNRITNYSGGIFLVDLSNITFSMSDYINY